jgi:DNA-binding CsgD family transcriptional regulator
VPPAGWQRQIRNDLMASPSRQAAAQNPASGARSAPQARRRLSQLLGALCVDAGARYYLLGETSFERGSPHLDIHSSNWVYDAVSVIGPDAIAALSAGQPGNARPNRVRPAEAAFLAQGEAETLAENGHAEIHCQRLPAGARHIYLLLSAPDVGRIDDRGVVRAGLRCAYAIAGEPGLIASPDRQALLSERERECLLWVSEGKTTDEVAVILGVSSNTVNSYVTHAIQKMGASNRAMAIASAIRDGLI